MSITLVTCWWDLEKRGLSRSRDFLSLGKPMLSLPLPMVIFCDPWVADHLREARESAKAPTVILDEPLEQLESFKRWSERLKSCSLPSNRNVPKDTPLFLAMGWSKPGMMGQVAKLNPYNTTHIGWLDLGVAHALTYEGKYPDRVSSLFDITAYEHADEQMHFHILRCIGNAPKGKSFYEKIWCMVAAGYMVGSPKSVIEFDEEFANEAEKVLASGKASIDEDLIASVICNNEEKYKYSYGNYCDIFSNHHKITTNIGYINWMIQDAKERGLFPSSIEKLQSMLPSMPKVSSTGKNLVKLNMIVKDESRRIKETLESVKSCIDSWTILDTGSKDGTQDIIREVLKDIPGELHERSIVTYAETGVIDYAATRNLGLELAGKDATFILLLNGDDILSEGEALKQFCIEHENTSEEAFHLEIRGEGGPNFVYPRLIRSTADWKYSVPTHEIISGKKPVSGTVPITWIKKCNDPAEVRFARWEKDVKVLERWLKDNPDNHRGLFYLAQTHECLSNFGETAYRVNHLGQACDLYKKRGTLGGWADEAYEANARAANLAERLLRPWDEIQQLLLMAHACAPHRAEPLSRVAQYWLGQGKHAVSYIFARRASEIPIPPPGPLNPDPSIYDVTIPDLLSRTAYYINKKDEGREGAKKAAQARPDNMNFRRNYHFYTQKLREVAPEGYLEINVVDKWERYGGWVYSTPSVCMIDGKLSAIVRMVNYKIRPDGSYDYDGTVRTRNFWTIFDENFVSIPGVEIIDKTGVPRTDYPVHGFEDCRLYYDKDAVRSKIWASCTVRDIIPGGNCHQARLAIMNNEFYEIDILSKHIEGHQKNWKPVVGSKGCWPKWIYSTEPLCVLDLGTSCADPVTIPPEGLKHSGRLLGSSQAIELPDGRWLWVDHEVSANDQGRERVYVHRFVLANAELSCVIAKSDPFYFRQLGIEFCCGLALIEGNRLVLSYSVHDESSELAVISLSSALRMLGQ